MQSAKLRQELDELVISLFRGSLGGGPGAARVVITNTDGIRQLGFMPKGWICLTTGGVHNEWADGNVLQYLDYPPIVSVERASPAQAAGILPGDTLISYDGQDVVAHPINVSQLLTPDRKLGVMVRRDGEKKAFTLTVGRMPDGAMFTKRLLAPGFPMPDVVGPGVGGDGPHRVTAVGPGGARFEFKGGPDQVFVFATGVFGADLSTVGPELAKKWKIETGVLVNEVPDETPASRAGLQAGDVIVTVAGQPVTKVDDVRKLSMMYGVNRPVTLQIVRDKKTRTITVPAPNGK